MQDIGVVDWIDSIRQSCEYESANNNLSTSSRLPLKLQCIVRRPKSVVSPQLHIVLLDTSASTLNQQSLSHAKGVVNSLSAFAYTRRHRIALIGFGNNEVKTLVVPSNARYSMVQQLDEISAGGGTPLRAGLEHVNILVEQRRNIAEQIHLYIMTDGRSRDRIQDIKINASKIVIFDMESSAVKVNRCQTLAQTLSANVIPINQMQVQ